MSLLTLTLILFLIMDPLGRIKGFINCVKHIEPKAQKRVIRREMLIALAFMLAFNFLGEYIFDVLQISETTLYLTSGLILFLAAVNIIFPSRIKEELKIPKEEPFIVPMAIPMIASPALLATIMLYAKTEPTLMPMVLAVIIAWFISSLILINSQKLLNVIGTSGITACERLMGLILVLLSVQRFAEGVILLFNPT